MARRKEEEEISEELNFAEYGINPEDFANVSSQAEKSNLSALSKRLRLINDAFDNIDSSMVSIVVSFDKIIDKYKLGTSVYKKEIKKIKENLAILDNALMEIVWHLDNIIEDVENGILFQNDCSLAQEKIINLIEFFSDLDNMFESIKNNIYTIENINEFEKDLKKKIYLIIESCDRFYFIFKKIKNIKNNLL